MQHFTYTRAMQWKLSVILVVVMTGVLSHTVPTAHAGLASQLVPCGNNIEYGGDANNIWYYGECDVCHLIVLGQNILNFLVVIMIAVAALIFVNAGWLYITSPGNSGNIARAHKLFTSTLMGILIILVAYLLIDTIMRVLISGNLSTEANINGYGPWNEILCEGMEDVPTIDGQRSYKIKKLSSIDLKASELVLPRIDCMSLPGAIGCASDCIDGYVGVSGTQCAGVAPFCCVLSGEGSEYLNKSCTMGDSGYVGSPGTCTTYDTCVDADRHVDSIGTEECGPELVCCQGTAPSDATKIDPCVAKAQLRDAGVVFPAGWASCECGNPVSMNTVNGLKTLVGTYPGKIEVTSITCEDHLSSAHPSGIAADLEDAFQGMGNIIKTTWTLVPGATWGDGTKVYQMPGQPIRCAMEATHAHCEFVTYSQTRDR